MEKNVMVCILLDLYSSLLTERQVQMLKLHYEEDMSLGEIAQQEGISRQGVLDALQKGEAVLYRTEEKLGLLEKEQRLRTTLNSLKELAEKQPQNNELTNIITDFEDILEGTHGI